MNERCKGICQLYRPGSSGFLTVLVLLALALAACASAEGGTQPPGVASSPTPFQPIDDPDATQAPPTAEQPSTPTFTPGEIETPAPPTLTDIPTETPTVFQPVAIPDPQLYTWTRISSVFQRPVGIEHAGDGSGRLFILEQAGLIRILQAGEVLPEPFLDIRQQVGCCGERGLLGLAFHPDYPQNGYFYLNYTDRNGDTVIARFNVSADPNRADRQSEVRLLFLDQPYPNHNGGAMAFGPDGYLYLGLGDGGSAGDPQGNGQSLGTLLGKILRVDVDSGDPYAIPPGNLFEVTGQDALPEIWAYGLRNPWRFSFDRLTGDLYIGDVGQGDREEINFMLAGSPAGANFGWNYREGSRPYRGTPPPGLELIDPVAEYDHSQGCSVTGGVVYRGAALPAWQGVYLYGDYCSGYIWGLAPGPEGAWQTVLLFESGALIASFGEDEAGEVYLADLNGNILQLVER